MKKLILKILGSKVVRYTYQMAGYQAKYIYILCWGMYFLMHKYRI